MALNARSMLLLCWTTGCWAFSFGVGTQVVTYFLKGENASDTVVGLSHAFYYFGQAVASFAVPWLTRRLGATRCVLIGMTFSGITLALFPWGGGVVGWYLLRFLNGWAGAMSLIPLETIVSRDSASDKKTQNFAYFGVSLTLGGALGTGIALHLFDLGQTLAFFLGGCAPVLGGLMLMGFFTGVPRTELHLAAVPLGWGRNFLSYGSAWAQGFLEGGMIAFLSLFLLSRGLTKEVAGMLMGAAMVGVILFQVPVSWLADRYGKTPMLLGCYGVVALTLLMIPWVPGSIWLGLVLFAFGACTGAMYPLGLSLLGDRMPENGLARAYAWYLAIECVGCQLGAAAMGWARDKWGETAMFAVGLAAVLAVLAAWLVLRQLLRDQAAAFARAAPESQRQAA